MSTYSVMYIYSSFSLSILPLYSLVVFVTLMKLRLAVVFGVHYFIRIPSLWHITHESYMEELSEYYKAWKTLRWFDGELCQECSIRYARNSRNRKLASRVLVQFLSISKYTFKVDYKVSFYWIVPFHVILHFFVLVK